MTSSRHARRHEQHTAAHPQTHRGTSTRSYKVKALTVVQTSF